MMTGTKAQCEAYATWSKADLQASVAYMRALSNEFKDAGVYVSTEGLSFPQQAKMVRADANGLPVTDGVFPESKEFLMGYWIVDVESAEQAYKLAARVSAAPGPGGVPGSQPVEVRQIMSSAPKEWL
jgi:hypothetical protein